MNQTDNLNLFNKSVLNKYHLYNSLFLKLPYEKIKNIGILIPILASYGREKLDEGLTPIQILDQFFTRFTTINDEDGKLDFMLKVIQYVERQIVLFDSVEDAAFSALSRKSEPVGIEQVIRQSFFQKNTKDLVDFLNDFSIRLVFTAHPTQFYPPSVQYIINDLKDAIEQDDVEQIDLLLQQLGQTPFYQKERPSPIDEANSIIYYLRNVYYDSIGSLYGRIKSLLSKENDFSNPNLIRLGFWPGGDRDGNPFVTHQVTLDVAKALKNTLMKCYYNDLKKLRRRVTFQEVNQPLKELSNRLYSSIYDPNAIMNHTDILGVLKQVHHLVIHKYHGLFQDDITAMIYKVECFKLHFASLDLRQDSSVVRQVMAKLDRGEDAADTDVQELLLTLQSIIAIQTNNGEEGCNRFIISNTEYDSDVLSILTMLVKAGHKQNEIDVDIVPLFETIHGLKDACTIMESLFKNPIYRDHLQHRNFKQTIMLGFSDGTKDGGYLKANWEIYKAKMELSLLCKNYNVEVIFFDGRGGPPARGGGKTQRFYASQGKNVSIKEIQLTIQGQTITSMYGTKEQFTHNCEQLLIAGINNAMYDFQNTKWTDQSKALMEELANLSHAKYTDLKNHPCFVSYLEKRSTLRYYTKANIGSRPGKRTNDASMKFSDLRAIPFVGSWAQLKQNVPGHYGIGSAIEQMDMMGRLDEVKNLYHNSAFFKALLLNSMMALQKSLYPLTAYLKDNKEFSTFYTILENEYYLTKKYILIVSGQTSLMEEEALSKASINAREEIVLPLLIIQQYAIEQVYHTSNPTYEKIIIRSMFGNINASRNSA